MYEIRIDETGRNNLKEDTYLFNTETKRVDTLQEIKDFLIERYGKMPSVKNKVYVDGKDNIPIENGFKQIGLL